MSELIFDKYEVIKRLAVGGMGEIFLARQRGVAGFDRLVILKSLLPDLAEQPGLIDQFLDEARVAATLNHPNIVSIYEVGAWQGVYFIAMEFINGESISGLSTAALRTGTMFGPPVCARVVHDAALGLDHAHHASDPDGNPLKIVHRDVTPQNIMVRTDGVTKVVDFGVARAANRSVRTTTGMVKGKIPYMPPEQLAGKEIDGRTDEWALGVVLWEMLTRQRLFQAENDAMVIGAILHKRIAPPSELVADVPPALDEIVMHMLQREKAKRFERLNDVAEVLQAYLDSVRGQGTEAEVAAFVKQAAGSKIQGRVTDLTPSKAENFLMSLGKTGESAQAGSRSGRSPPRGISGEPGSRSGRSRSQVGLPAQDDLSPEPGSRSGRPRTRSRQVEIAEPPPPEPIAPAPRSKLGLFLALGAVGVLLAAGGVLAVTRPWEPPPLPPEIVLVPTPPKPVDPPKPKVIDPVPIPAPKPVEPDTVLRLASDPDEAKVYSGERLLGQTPLRLSSLSPDTDYQLVVEKDGFEPSIVKVRLEKSKTSELSVALKKKVAHKGPTTPGPAPGPAPAGDAFLTLKTTPWTKVTVAGTPYGSTPLFKLKLPPGRHTLILVNDEAGINVTRSVELKAGEVTKLDLQLK